MKLPTGENYDHIISPTDAKKIIKLIFTSKEWINRRVDSVSFPDGHTLHRRVSVDAVAPKELPSIRLKLGAQFTLLPIAYLRKEAFVNFNFRDVNDRSIPKVPRSLGRSIMKTMLVEWARALGADMATKEEEETVERTAEKVLREDYPEHYRNPSLDRYLRDGREWNFQDPNSIEAKAFLVLARALSRNFILFLALERPPDRGQRIMVKYEYDRPLHLYKQNVLKKRQPRPLRRQSAPKERRALSLFKYIIAQALGWEYMDLIIGASNASYSRSYHFELTVPEDAGLVEAGLYDEDKAKRKKPPPRLSPDTRQAPKATRFGIYPLGTIPWGTRGRAFFRISPARTFWKTIVLAMSALITGILSFLAYANPAISSKESLVPASAIFLTTLLPAALGSKESGFARRMLAPTRVAAVIVGVIPLIFVISIINTDQLTSKYEVMARWLAVASGIIFGRQIIVWLTAVPSTGIHRYPSTWWKVKERRELKGIKFASESIQGIPQGRYIYEHRLLKKERIQGKIQEAIFAFDKPYPSDVLAVMETTNVIRWLSLRSNGE